MKKPRPEVYIVSGALALGGLALVLLAFRGKPGAGPVAPVNPGEQLTGILTTNMEVPALFNLRRGERLAATDPTVMYSGPGRDSYSYFQILQFWNGEWVSVYGSGVAGVHLGPATGLTRYHLVGAEQLQPPGCPEQSLCARAWPGDEITPICGRPPELGAATAVVEIYERKRPEDADGFSSPTCNARVPVLRRAYPNKINFVD